MKSFLCALLAVTFSFASLHAAEKSSEKHLTAFKTLEIAQKQLGESGHQLLQMESKYAKLKPLFWWIRFYDPKLFLKVRAVHMIGSEMVQNIEPGNPFDGGDEEFVIERDLLKYDSDKCIKFMERAAKENNIPLFSMNILLEKPHPGESNPIWTFEWFDEQNRSLGIIRVSATTGRVTEIIGLKIKTHKLEGVAKKTMSQDVEDTFLGIGGDLEQFFTGKRTVDKDDAGPKD